MPLGWVTEIGHSAKIDNLGELKTWHDSSADGTIEIRLMPANNNQMTVRLDGAREASGIDSVTPTRPAADVTLPAGTGQENLSAGPGQTDWCQRR